MKLKSLSMVNNEKQKLPIKIKTFSKMIKDILSLNFIFESKCKVWVNCAKQKRIWDQNKWENIFYSYVY